MTWLLGLYPPAWRRRYGAEFRQLIGAQRFSIGAAIDVLAGAIDAWIDPQAIQPTEAARTAEKGDAMSHTWKLYCSRVPGTTKADSFKAAAVMLGGTLLLTGVWMALRIRYGSNAYLNTFSSMPFFISLAVSAHFTNLKGRRPMTQFIFITGTIAIVALILGVAGWIGSAI